MTVQLDRPLTIRQATSRDWPEIVELVRLALFDGAGPETGPGGRLEAFLSWKHQANAFGASPVWVAEDGGRIVGVRTFMRWEFTAGGRVLRAVRAVDTATHPEFQGRGIFRALTTHGLAALREEGVDFVFNTPNAKSRPGYLSMGWEPVGGLAAGILPRSPAVLPRLAAARVPADVWSLPSGAGAPAPEVLADREGVRRLLARAPVPPGLATRRSAEYVAWRYGHAPLHYRALVAGGSVADGVLLFRLRRRGAATELSVGDILLPPGSPGRALRLVRRALRVSGADYALGLRSAPGAAFVPLPGQGPVLTWRSLGPLRAPALPHWALSLGDIEMF